MPLKLICDLSLDSIDESNAHNLSKCIVVTFEDMQIGIAISSRAEFVAAVFIGEMPSLSALTVSVKISDSHNPIDKEAALNVVIPLSLAAPAAFHLAVKIPPSPAAV